MQQVLKALKTNLYISVQIMDNIKYSDDLFIDDHY